MHVKLNFWYSTRTCRPFFRDMIKIGVVKLTHLSWEMLSMVLAIQSQLLFSNYWFPSMMMEVAGGWNLILTVLLSKFSNWDTVSHSSSIFIFCCWDCYVDIFLMICFVGHADVGWLWRWDCNFLRMSKLQISFNPFTSSCYLLSLSN